MCGLMASCSTQAVPLHYQIYVRVRYNLISPLPGSEFAAVVPGRSPPRFLASHPGKQGFDEKWDRTMDGARAGSTLPLHRRSTMVVERNPWMARGQGQYIGVLARRQREGCGLNNLRYMDGESFSLSASRLVSLSLSLSHVLPFSFSHALSLVPSSPPVSVSFSFPTRLAKKDRRLQQDFKNTGLAKKFKIPRLIANEKNVSWWFYALFSKSSVHNAPDTTSERRGVSYLCAPLLCRCFTTTAQPGRGGRRPAARAMKATTDAERVKK